jgi:isochorismate hydrolase
MRPEVKFWQGNNQILATGPVAHVGILQSAADP